MQHTRQANVGRLGKTHPTTIPHDSLTEPLVLVEGVEGGEGLAALVTLDLLPAVRVHSLVAAQV